MNLDFSDDQKLLQSEAQKFLQKEQSLQRSRDVLDGEQALDTDLWQQIIAMGWTGIRIPCLLYTSPSPRDRQKSRMPSSA